MCLGWGQVSRLGRQNRVDLALSYARGQPWVSQVVLGAETAEQLRDNIAACESPPLTGESSNTCLVSRLRDALGSDPKLSGC